MKKIILAAMALIPCLGFAQNTFVLKGKIGEDSAPAKAFLLYRDGEKTVTDSTTIVKGSFQFTGPVGEPTLARIIVDHKGAGFAKTNYASDMSMIYLERGVIGITSPDSLKRAVITGSPVNTEKKKFDAFVAVTQKQIDQINSEYAMAPAEKKKDPAFVESIQEKYKKVMVLHEAKEREFIKANPGSFFSLVALKQIAGPVINLPAIEPVFNSLSPALRQSEGGIQFKKLLDLSRATSVGNMAPDFTQNDVNDKPVKLSDFRGKYVLIDFWASWCGPCRAENPNVVKAYNQYKNKNFTVISISLDQPGKKNAWLVAIKADGLEWTQLSDLNFWNNKVAVLYGIKSIPQNFLLDKSGKIIAANLRGEELEKKLAEVIPN